MASQARQIDVDSVVLSDAVERQLRLYVSEIAAMYRRNPFHNFAHATHVSLSVEKLLSRIVAPSDLGEKILSSKNLHDHTYGITSDPLTQFACVLTALIHDVDHSGVPNSQLVKEKARSPFTGTMGLDSKYGHQVEKNWDTINEFWKFLVDGITAATGPKGQDSLIHDDQWLVSV